MTNMIEKVARAICGGYLDEPCNGPKCDCGYWEASLDEAKAAIAAYREPTDEMVLAAAGVLLEAVKLDGLEPDVDDRTDGVVVAMLRKAADAALGKDEK